MVPKLQTVRAVILVLTLMACPVPCDWCHPLLSFLAVYVPWFWSGPAPWQRSLREHLCLVRFVRQRPHSLLHSEHPCYRAAAVRAIVRHASATFDCPSILYIYKNACRNSNVKSFICVIDPQGGAQRAERAGGDRAVVALGRGGEGRRSSASPGQRWVGCLLC